MNQNDYTGTWISPTREPMQNADGSTVYLIRDFTLSPDGWQLRLSAYGDPTSAQSKMFAATVEGPLKVTGASSAVAGAQEAEFTFKKVTFTPYIDFLVNMLNQQHSGSGNWRVGETQDVSQTGALGFMPVSKYPKEYDLLKRDGDKLYLGKRPSDNNMGSPEKRPRELTPHPVVKQR